MSFNLQTYLLAGYPGIMICGAEDKRILADISVICKDMAIKKGEAFGFRVWTVAGGWQIGDKIDFNKEGVSTINDIKEALKQALSFKVSGCYCLVNFHFFLKDPGIIQLIKEIIYKWKSTDETESKHLIFVENVLIIPPELEKEITVLDYELPNKIILEEALNIVITDPAGKMRIQPLGVEHKDKVLSAALGMTYLEAENAFAISLIEKESIDVDIINREKGQMLKKGGLLELFPATETLDDVGGLDNLKEWIRKRAKAFTPEARKFGITPPRGIILTGISGSGKCVDGDSFLWYNGGVKRIRQLLKGYKHIGNTEQTFPINIPVLSFNTKNSRFVCQKATMLIKNPIKDGFCLNLQYGYQIKTSPWHPIWCSVDNKLEYRKIEDLINKNDVWVPIKVGHTNWENNTKYLRIKVSWELYTKNKREKTKHTNVIVLNNDVGYLLGVLLGDGSLSQLTRQTQHTFSFTTADIYIVNEVTRILKDNFSDATIYRGSSKYKYTISCPELSSFIRLLQANCRAEAKGIPDFIFESPKSVIVALLQGLFDTDGYSSKKTGYIQYCSSSEELARDIHNLLLALGILCRLHFKSNKCLGAWVIDIYGENTSKFYNIIGFRLPRKQENRSKLSQIFNTNLKLYPPSLRPVMKRLFLTREQRGVHLNFYTKNNGLGNSKASNKWVKYYINTKSGRTPSFKMLKIFEKDMCAKNDVEFQQYYGYGEIVWLPLKDIVSCKVDLYDLSVLETNSFVANGIINHNSLCAKAMAQVLKQPLIRVDIGKVFGSLVGLSEERARTMTKQLDAMAPCLAWIDEAEKGFSGTKGSGINDNGVTMRVLGTFLTWLAETKYPVFCVMTVNNVELLPPELLRKGRFDELFFVDLPNNTERKQIFEIHLKKRNRLPKKFNIELLSKISEGYVGSEIEEAIKTGLFDAFDAGREIITEDIVHALKSTVPLVKTMEKEIAALRQWAEYKAVKASREDTDIKTSRRRVSTGDDTIRERVSFS